MPEESLQEKTEEPTPRRREEARQRGQVPKSREVAAVAVLSGGLLAFFVGGSYMVGQMMVVYRHFLHFGPPRLDLKAAEEILWVAVTLGMKAVFPVVLLVFVLAFLSLYLQVGGVVAWEALQPKWERINPLEGFKRLFSLPSLVELLKSIFKIVIIGLVSYFVISGEKERILLLAGQGVEHVGRELFAMARGLLLKVLFALLALALLDFLFQRWETERHLRMTKEELKEEMKQTEGDPWVKSRIRQIQRSMAQKRMMSEVPKADVIITNPQHLAVAIKYELGEMPAPQVLVKGAGFLALKIREVAEAHGVPIVENPPLAQALYREVEEGEYIPQELYQAVAEVLAFVYRLKGKVKH